MKWLSQGGQAALYKYLDGHQDLPISLAMVCNTAALLAWINGKQETSTLPAASLHDAAQPTFGPLTPRVFCSCKIA